MYNRATPYARISCRWTTKIPGAMGLHQI